MVNMTFEEAQIAFEKEVSYFEKTDKEYLLNSDEFLYVLEKFLFEEEIKYKESYNQIKNKYIPKQLAIIDEKIEFPELFAKTFEIQKLYKRENKKIAFSIKQSALKYLLKFVKSNIGKILLYVIISKIDINDSPEEKMELTSYISENLSEILSKIKKPMSKAIMYGEKFKLKPTGNYSDAIKILIEDIPTFGYDFEVLCKHEIRNFLYENLNVQQDILSNISENIKKFLLNILDYMEKIQKHLKKWLKQNLKEKVR